MEMTVTQNDDDKTDYVDLFCKYLAQNSIRTKEQLEFSYDILACEFATIHGGTYQPCGNIMTILKPSGA